MKQSTFLFNLTSIESFKASRSHVLSLKKKYNPTAQIIKETDRAIFPYKLLMMYIKTIPTIVVIPPIYSTMPPGTMSSSNNNNKPAYHNYYGC